MKEMDCSTQYLPYESTGFFSTIVTDYLKGNTAINAFQAYAPTISGIQSAIENRKKANTNRAVLVAQLREQYEGLHLAEAVEKNIQLLAQPNCFTITTAHQPNVLTGPLYYIYKILHAVKLAEELKKSFPSEEFVPVYYMGSEDADLDELGFINAGEQHLVWETKQKGAVGRMKVDKGLKRMIDALAAQINVLPHGAALIDLFHRVYTEGKTIQQATLELVNELFGRYGVVVLIPDNSALKTIFSEVVKKELTEKFSQQIVATTAEALGKHYKVQAAGRPINLFYLIDDHRERIEESNGVFTVEALGLKFTQEEMLKELELYPARFSANVILRGVFQSTILPDVVFIGGGGELAYWLELKEVFDAVHVPYPALVLRNSFLFVEGLAKQKMKQLKLTETALFKPELQLINELVNRRSSNDLDLEEQVLEFESIYRTLRWRVDSIDKNLIHHINALEANTVKKIKALEKKVFRAEKQKFETAINQIKAIKALLFPSNSLQERHQNMALLYAKYGPSFIDCIYQSSKGLQQEFCVISV